MSYVPPAEFVDKMGLTFVGLTLYSTHGREITRGGMPARRVAEPIAVPAE